jgi:hypothetical protein
MVKFFKDGDRMGVATTCKNEDAFLKRVSVALSDMIDEGHHEGDWHFQLDRWLPCVVDICYQMRDCDYEKQMYQAGDVPPLDLAITERKVKDGQQ